MVIILDWLVGKIERQRNNLVIWVIINPKLSVLKQQSYYYLSLFCECWTQLGISHVFVHWWWLRQLSSDHLEAYLFTCLVPVMAGLPDISFFTWILHMAIFGFLSIKTRTDGFLPGDWLLLEQTSQERKLETDFFLTKPQKSRIVTCTAFCWL